MPNADEDVVMKKSRSPVYAHIARYSTVEVETINEWLNAERITLGQLAAYVDYASLDSAIVARCVDTATPLEWIRNRRAFGHALTPDSFAS